MACFISNLTRAAHHCVQWRRHARCKRKIQKSFLAFAHCCNGACIGWRRGTFIANIDPNNLNDSVYTPAASGYGFEKSRYQTVWNFCYFSVNILLNPSVYISWLFRNLKRFQKLYWAEKWNSRASASSGIPISLEFATGASTFVVPFCTYSKLNALESNHSIIFH